jgi:hypothetical protein
MSQSKKTDDELIEQFENGEDLSKEDLERVAEVEPRYASMIEVLEEEDKILSNVDQDNSNIIK